MGPWWRFFSSKRLKARYVYYLVALSAFFWLWVLYPGAMSTDSIEQLNQARTKEFGDWHPPLMSWLWFYLDQLIPGPFGLIVFHQLLYWGALALLITGFFINPSLLVIGGLLFTASLPPITALLGVAWKDVSLGTSLLLSIALLHRSVNCSQKKHRLLYGAAAILSLFYASSVRHNSLSAVLPIAIYAAYLFSKNFILQSSRKAFLSLSVILPVVLFILSTVVSNLLTKGTSTHPVQQILSHDLAAISLQTQKIQWPALDSQGVGPLNLEELKQIYRPESVIYLFCCNDAPKHLAFVKSTEELSALKDSWLKAVLKEPGTYLSHRWTVFKKQLSLGESEVCYPYHPYFVTGSTQDISFSSPRWITKKFLALVHRLKDSFLFRGYFYLTALFGIFIYAAIACKKRTNNLHLFVLALSSSGLCYFLPYFFVSTTCDFRMHWWSALATIFSLMLYGFRAIHLKLTKHEN